MNRTFIKEIMKRIKSRNSFLKNRTEENRKKYTKHRNFCVSLLRKAKQNYLIVLMRRKLLIIGNFGKLLNQCFLVKVSQMKK